MAIEGKDWWAIVGAAAGGLLAGAAGCYAYNERDQRFTGFRRWYTRSIPTKKDEVSFKSMMFSVLIHRSVAMMFAHNDGSISVKIYEIAQSKEDAKNIPEEKWVLFMISDDRSEEDGGNLAAQKEGFDSFDEAADWADEYQATHEMTPITEWGVVGGEEIAVIEAKAAKMVKSSR